MALYRVVLGEAGRGLLRRHDRPLVPVAIEVRDGHRSATLRHAFPHVHALRWAPRAGKALLCGTTLTDGVLSEQERERGHRRLYVGDLDRGDWYEFGHEWYDDPVELAGSVVAASTQNGLRFLAPDGSALRNQMMGRFSWGAPGLSASPSGERLAHLRWRGDEPRLCVSTPDGSLVRELGHSCFRYCWWGEDHLVHYVGRDLLLTDVTTGRTVPAWAGLLAAPADDALDVLLAGAGAGEVSVLLGEVQVHEGRLHLGVRVLGPDLTGALSLVVSLDRAGTVRLEAELEPDAVVTHLDVLDGGALAVALARDDGERLLPQGEQVLGPVPDWWEQGWRPLPDGTRPVLGFRSGAFG